MCYPGACGPIPHLPTMEKKREMRIRAIAQQIRVLTADLPAGKAMQISNRLDRMLLECKKDSRNR